jgi:hypothetical protein
VSENSIETLDLSALNMLACVKCSRNQLMELSLSGKALTSLIAGNNSKYNAVFLSPSPVVSKVDKSLYQFHNNTHAIQAIQHRYVFIKYKIMSLKII